MISTAEDLVRLCVALNHGRLLKSNTVALMYDAHLQPVMMYEVNGPPSRLDSRRGLIWSVVTENGRMIVSHDGSVKGFNALLINYPEEDVAAAVMYNAAGPPTCTEAKTLANFFLSVPSSRP